MSEEAKKIDDGAYDAEIVETPTPFQRSLERIIEDKRQESQNNPSVRPALMRTLEADSKVTESKISPELRSKAEAVFAKLKEMKKEEQAEFRSQIMRDDPELISVMLAIYQEQAAHLEAKLNIEETHRRERIRLQEQAHAITDQAMMEAVREGEDELENLKKASGE